MNSRISISLALGIGLLAGFGVGRISAPGALRSSTPATDAGLSTRQAADSPGDDPDSAPHAAKTKRSQAKQVSAPRVPLPIAAVTESLRKTQFSRHGFGETFTNLPAAMKLLGIEEERQEAVKSAMKDIWTRVLAEEKQRVKVSKVTDTEVVLDQRPMLETAAGLAAEAQDRIRAELPPDLADILIGAIDWKHFYAENEGESSTFRIVRDLGGLVARRMYGDESAGRLLDANQYPDDGTPIPIGKVLGDDRWTSLLGDYKLLPSDETK